MAHKDCHFNFIRHILNCLQFFVADVLRCDTGEQGFAGAYHVGNFLRMSRMIMEGMIPSFSSDLYLGNALVVLQEFT